MQARELRKQEVWLKVPPRRSDTDTGSETEVKVSHIYTRPSTRLFILPRVETKLHFHQTKNAIILLTSNDQSLLRDIINITSLRDIISFLQGIEFSLSMISFNKIYHLLRHWKEKIHIEGRTKDILTNLDLHKKKTKCYVMVIPQQSKSQQPVDDDDKQSYQLKEPIEATTLSFCNANKFVGPKKSPILSNSDNSLSFHFHRLIDQISISRSKSKSLPNFIKSPRESNSDHSNNDKKILRRTKSIKSKKSERENEYSANDNSDGLLPFPQPRERTNAMKKKTSQIKNYDGVSSTSSKIKSKREDDTSKERRSFLKHKHYGLNSLFHSNNATRQSVPRNRSNKSSSNRDTCLIS